MEKHISVALFVIIMFGSLITFGQGVAVEVKASPSPSPTVSGTLEAKKVKEAKVSFEQKNSLEEGFDGTKTVSSMLLEQKKSSTCSVSVRKTIGFYSSYDGLDVGSRFHSSRVFQGDLDLEFCSNKKVAYGFNQWWSLSTKENPSSGSETDAVGRIVIQLPRQTTIKFDGGVFIVEGGEIYKAGVTISKSFKPKEVDLSIVNGTTVYWIGGLNINGGFVNKTELPISKGFKEGKWSLTVTPALSFDNNPFGLGSGKLASMGFLSCRIDIPVSNRVSFFAKGTQYWKNFGASSRGPGRVGGFGLVFRIS